MDNKTFFIETLRSTGRKGMENVIAHLVQLGFFEAPASAGHHLNTSGGLLQHSINVYKEALAIHEKQNELCPQVVGQLSADSIAIASLLHDVCKAEVYKPAQKSRKAEDGSWEKYMGYNVDYSDFPMGHGEKSVIRLLQWGLEMTEDEMLAIRWHMGPWELPLQSADAKGNNNSAKLKSPLVTIISAADGLATFLLENEGNSTCV